MNTTDMIYIHYGLKPYNCLMTSIFWTGPLKSVYCWCSLSLCALMFLDRNIHEYFVWEALLKVAFKNLLWSASENQIETTLNHYVATIHEAVTKACPHKQLPVSPIRLLQKKKLDWCGQRRGCVRVFLRWIVFPHSSVLLQIALWYSHENIRRLCIILSVMVT